MWFHIPILGLIWYAPDVIRYSNLWIFWYTTWWDIIFQYGGLFGTQPDAITHSILGVLTMKPQHPIVNRTFLWQLVACLGGACLVFSDGLGSVSRHCSTCVARHAVFLMLSTSAWTLWYGRSCCWLRRLHMCLPCSRSRRFPSCPCNVPFQLGIYDYT